MHRFTKKGSPQLMSWFWCRRSLCCSALWSLINSSHCPSGRNVQTDTDIAIPMFVVVRMDDGVIQHYFVLFLLRPFSFRAGYCFKRNSTVMDRITQTTPITTLSCNPLFHCLKYFFCTRKFVDICLSSSRRHTWCLVCARCGDSPLLPLCLVPQ